MFKVPVREVTLLKCMAIKGREKWHRIIVNER